MRVQLVRGLLLVLAVGAIPAMAAAEDQKPDQKDPNRMICEKQKELGSRVATKKICMTAAEWEIRRREDRAALEQAQVRRSGPAGN